MQEQMHLAPEQFGELGARLAADFLDPLTLVAEDDRALVVACDQNLLVDFGAAVLARREFLGLDGRLVRQFLMELAIQLLAGDFGGEHPFGGVADFILREMPRSLRHQGRQRRLEFGNSVAGARRDEEGFVEGNPLVELGRDGQQFVLLGQVDLVEDQEFLLGSSLDPLQNAFGALAELCRGIDHHQDRLGLVEVVPRRGDHRAVEPAGRGKNAWGVDQHDLRLAVHGDAHQAGACRLRLGTDDRDLLADERVDDGRFARIRRADDRDETATMGHSFNPSRIASIAIAAAFSAACFDAPSPSASASLPTITPTRKRGAWSGPSRRIRRYSGGLRPLAAAHSCSAALGCLGADTWPSIISPQCLTMKARAGSPPWSSHSAPISASSTSAAILSLYRPPSPIAWVPKRTCALRSSPCAIRAQVSPEASTWRRDDSSPSLALGKRRKSSDAMTRPSTRS